MNNKIINRSMIPLVRRLGEFLNKIFPSLLLVLIFSFVFIFGVSFFKRIFIEQNSNYINNAIGAFMGAFFAFLFVRVSDVLTRIYERQLKHYNALVELEHIFNGYLNIVSENIFVIENFIGLIQRAIKTNQPLIYFNVLHEFPVRKEIILNLANLELINEVFSFKVSIDRINKSIRTINRSYNDIKNAFFQRNINFETYKLNLEKLSENLKEVRSFLLDLNEENKQILAKVRILMKDKPFLSRLIHFIVAKKRYDKRINTEISKEIEKIGREIEINKEKSKAKIERILKSNNN